MNQRTVQSEPLIHIPLYCWNNASDRAMRSMVQQLLGCLQSYFAHENTYALLVTTNDRRPLEILSAYKKKTGYGFKLRFVTQDDLLSVFKTDQSRLRNTSCIRMIFSKFYPILNHEAEAVIHVDFDTMFAARIDLKPLLVSDIGLVDANQFWPAGECRAPTERHADFFRLPEPVRPSWNWINSGVFSVQRRGFQLVADEVSHYLENLERAIADNITRYGDEIIMNALAIRESDAVTVIPDYRYNFLAYFLKHDPTWTTCAQIIHFHSVKPNSFCFVEGALTHSCDEVRAKRVNEDLYLAVLMWFRHLHGACRGLPYRFPLLEAIPPDVVESEIAIRCGSAMRGTALGGELF
jgi:hypothetical protein